MARSISTKNHLRSTKDRLLTSEEVCERLNVRRRWLRRADEQRLLTKVKIGGQNRYTEASIEEYIESRTIPAGE